MEPFKEIERLRSLHGQIVAFDNIHSYPSCPGVEKHCGKKIKEGDVYCSKLGCNWKVEMENAEKDFNVGLVFIDSDDAAHCILAFKKVVRNYLKEAVTIEEQLEPLLNVPVKVLFDPKRDDDSNDILEDIIFTSG